MSISPETPVIAVLAAAAIGQPCGESLDQLAAIDPYQLPANSQVDLLVALERHAGWIAALTAHAMVAIAGPDRDALEPDPQDPITCDPFVVFDPAREEIATALRTSGASAANRLGVARDLEAKLPRTG